MWPFAVAGLGLRYLRIRVSEMLGHPLRKPRRVALRSVDIFGLHRDWCANLTLFARVKIEWAKFAVWRTVVGGSDVIESGGVACTLLMGMVHKSVFGSLCPCSIVSPWCIMLQWSLQNVTVHPASQRTRMSDAIDRLGTMCPVSTSGNPGIVMSQQ